VELSFSEANIRLRPFEPEDAAELYTILNHPELAGRRYIPWEFPALAPLARRQVEAVLKKWAERENGLRLAVILEAGEQLVGHMALDWGWDTLNPSLALVISPERQRQGLGSATLQAGLRYLFESTPANCVSADWIADWNLPARRFLEKHGFVKTGEPRWVGMRAGRPLQHDHHGFAALGMAGAARRAASGGAGDQPCQLKARPCCCAKSAKRTCPCW
jgi:RimJ/RimL family protein N-acetyltransferase